MSDYSLRKKTDLTNLTFEDIIDSATTLPHKSEDSTFTGFRTPSPAESLHLEKIVSTDIFESGHSSPTYTKPTIMELDITDIKSDWESKRMDIDDKLDGLVDLFDDFGPIADEFTVHGGSFDPVEDHWKQCHTAFQTIKKVEKQLNKYNQTELEKEKKVKGEIASVKSRIDEAKRDYARQHDVYLACGSDAKKANASKGATKKEEVKIPTFDPETSDWDSWSTLIKSEAEAYDNDQLKKNFLLEKLMRSGKDLLIHHRTFSDCMETLQGAYGDPIKITNERINAFIKWAQEPVSPISKTDRLSEDVAKLSGLAARLVQPRDKACKCKDKKDCKADNHKLNDHCSNHCEYDTLKEDSDKLHSIIIAIAGNRLPTSMIETVGSQARQAEKHQSRTLDVKTYVQMLQEHINNLKIARSNINPKSFTETYREAEYFIPRQPRMGARNEGYGRNDSTAWKFQSNGQRGNSFGSSRFNNGRSSNDINCFYCSGPHRLFNCITAKNDNYRNVLQKIQEAGACTLCMSPSHHASNCNRKGEQSCEYCRTKNIAGHNTHHVVVCPKKPKREQVNIGGEVETSLPNEFYD